MSANESPFFTTLEIIKQSFSTSIMEKNVKHAFDNLGTLNQV